MRRRRYYRINSRYNRYNASYGSPQNHTWTGRHSFRKNVFLDSLNFTSQVFSFVRDPVNSIIKELGTYEELCLSEKELVQEITVQKLKELIFNNPELKVIDLREEYEKTPINFKTLSIPFHEINQKLHLIPQNGPKVFYCGHGIKSSIVINYLQKVHYMNDLYSLKL